MKGQLPSGWAETSLGQVTWPSKLSAKPSEEVPQAYLGMDNVEASSTKILGSEISTNIRSLTRPFTPGDTLYGRLRPYLNKVCTPEFRGLASSEFIVFPPSRALANNFLKYLLNSQTFVSFANNISDGDRPRVKWNQIKDWPFQLPPLAEQQRIVDAIEEHLSRIDAAESTAQTALTKLDTLRRTVLTAAFSGRLVKPFNPRRTPDGLPEDWHNTTLNEVMHDSLFLDGDWVETKDQDPSGSVRLIQLADIGEGYFRDRSDRWLNDQTANRLRCTFLQEDDILIARMPDPIGRACLMPDIGGRSVTAVDVCILRPNSNHLSSRYLMWQFNSPAFRIKVEALQSGTTRKRISRKNLATIPIFITTPAEQKRIVAAIEEHFSRIDTAKSSLERCLQRCRVLRQAVLTAAFAGRLVEQDPNDQPASVLLEQITAEQPKRRTRRKSA